MHILLFVLKLVILFQKVQPQQQQLQLQLLQLLQQQQQKELLQSQVNIHTNNHKTFYLFTIYSVFFFYAYKSKC